MSRPSAAGLLRAAALLAVLAAGRVSADPADVACQPRVERVSAASASLRPHVDAFRHCLLDEAGYQRVVAAWLAAPGTTTAGLRSLYLGRLEHYPWLVAALGTAARAEPAWQGRHTPGMNALVAAWLQRDAVRARLEAPLAGSGLRVAGVSVEKVLVGPAAGSAGMPVDAQAWLLLEGPASPAEAGDEPREGGGRP